MPMPTDLGRILGLVERHAHVRLRTEIVDLVRLVLLRICRRELPSVRSP